MRPNYAYNTLLLTIWLYRGQGDITQFFLEEDWFAQLIDPTEKLKKIVDMLLFFLATIDMFYLFLSISM